MKVRTTLNTTKTQTDRQTKRKRHEDITIAQRNWRDDEMDQYTLFDMWVPNAISIGFESWAKL